MNRWPLGGSDKAGVFQARGHTRSDNITLTLALARQGVGIARVMDLLALPLIRRGELVTLLEDQIDPQSVPIHAPAPRVFGTTMPRPCHSSRSPIGLAADSTG